MSAILNPVPTPHQPSPRPALVPTPEKPRAKSALLIWGSLGILLLATVLAWNWYSARQEAEAQASLPTYRTAKAMIGSIQQTARVTGVTTARNFNNITCPKLTGPEGNRPMTILQMVPNGSLVRKGQVVIQIDGQGLQDHIDDLVTTVDQAQGDVDKRKAEQALDLEILGQNVRIAKSELDKVRLDVKARELRTSLDQELLQLAVEETEAKYTQLAKEVEIKKQAQASELKILVFTSERHARHLGRHKMDLKKFTVSASMDGLAVVQTMFRGGEFDSIKVGDVVAPGQLAMKIVDPKSMQIEGTINQAQVSQFRIGETAAISIDAFPGMNFKGKLYSVGALAVAGGRQQSYIRTIPIRVSIDGYDPKLIPDLSAAADVLIASSEEKTVVIPRGAMYEENGKSYVFAKLGANFVKREVTTGAMNNTQIGIQSGLNEGEEVALNYVQPIVQVAGN